MKKYSLLIITFISCLVFVSFDDVGKYVKKQGVDKNGYKYEYVTDDPMGVRTYTLENGLKVYLSVNKDKPRIETYIAVRAGSTYDPEETTGLAHYLEHMMFKGTSKIGTKDWEKEKVYLDQLSDLYEEHYKTNDAEEKKRIYAEIDRISLIAADYAISNEYDKMVASIGAKNTNAHTSFEETVYKNNIPSNMFENWLLLERERFDGVVLRLFHTELEAVYEEFNMGQDSDGKKMFNKLLSGLFKNHHYGTQTTIGEAEHLKSPSMVNIYNYFNTYYVPNNMAICLSGDLVFESAIAMIDKHWGNMKPNENLPELKFDDEEPIQAPVEKHVYGPDAEWLFMGYRFNGANSDDNKYVSLIDMILCNGKAGLIDLNLNQAQKVLNARCSPMFMKDYGMHYFMGWPREGQSLEEVRDLLLEEVEKIKKGEFEEWLIDAVINDLRLNQTRGIEYNSRAASFYSSFINNVEWNDYLKEIDELEKITKAELVAFANKHYNDNYVIAYKHIGKDSNVVKVDKPKISPVPINRVDRSDFMTDFVSIEAERLKPVFVDFEKEISTKKLASGIELSYLENKTNELFSLNYIIEMGKKNMMKLPLAVRYLPYLGTSKYSPKELKEEFYKHGLSFSVSAGQERSYVSISGIKKSFDKGIELLEHVLADAQPNEEVLVEYIEGILKKRNDSKLSKGVILNRGMVSYAKYGDNSPFKNILSEEELKNIKAEELTDIVKEIFSYEHRLFYYGEDDINIASGVIDKHHKINADLKKVPPMITYEELGTTENKVYFANYDMVQSSIIMLAKDELLNIDILPEIKVFGQFYGGGLSSIVFQEIRESKALAYSAYCGLTTPSTPDRAHYVIGFVGTSADKLKNATEAMMELMNEMPKAEMQFEAAKESIIKSIESERITKTSVFWAYQGNLDKGLNYDIRKDVYEKVQTMTLEEFEVFFKQHISGKKYTFLVLGNKKDIDFNVLKKIGKVEELSLNQIFGY